MRLSRRRLLNPITLIIGLALSLTFGSIFWSPLGAYLFQSGSSYAVISVLDEVDDHWISSTLAAAGFTDLISASSQWVDIADFNGLKPVLISDYLKRIDPADPRLDSYADRLLRLFESDGERRFFLPRPDAMAAARIKKALANVDHRLYFPTKLKITPIICFIIFAVIVLITSRKFQLLWPPLLSLTALASYGNTGLASAAGIFLAIFVAVELANSLACRLVPSKSLKASSKSAVKLVHSGESLWLFMLLSGAALLVAITGGVPVLMTGLSLTAAVAASLVVPVLKTVLEGRRGHLRFVPLRIMTTSQTQLRTLLRIGPLFLAVWLLSFLIDSGYSQIFNIQGGWNQSVYQLPDLEAYRSHLSYQMSFSYNTVDHSQFVDYQGFSLDEQGLLSLAVIDKNPIPQPEMPPLEHYVLSSPPVSQPSDNPIIIVIVTIVASGALLIGLASIINERQRRLNWHYTQKRAAA